MSFAKRKAAPVPTDQLPDVDDEEGWKAWRIAQAPIWRAKREAENAEDPRGYRGTIRTIEGDLGHMQHGTYYDQGQATEMYRCPLVDPGHRRWRYGNEWDWAIAVLALNDGSWLCWHSNSLPKPKGWDRNRDRFMPSGGFSLHSLRFFTRDAAIRANVAYVIERARRQHRWKPDPNDTRSYFRSNPWPGGDMPASDAQAIIAWAMEVAARPAPVLFVAPPPPPPPPPEPTDLLMWIEQGRQA
ncbi:hypothetical protein M9979_12230 [Sphingomonas sp. RP10(2022)]|uniref:Uncharacterized protein n=1 Tax=Sphingomonas liriopis TaxID=2949094 RepID=A0A9X2KRI5_9SPHN|nr:hypothetical protein [Sphingomonas liriopis]MCP3735641.1 hypothetical protein [Sphingomonas liriopis]